MDISLEAQGRKLKGTSDSKRARRLESLIPGVIYGGKGEPQMISITDKALRKISQNESFFSQIINLKVDGAAERVVLKELQRHPYRPFFIHADFLRIKEDVRLTMSIPLHFLNAETCKGVKQQGGMVSFDLTELEISCLPKDLPAFIEVDLAEVELNQILHISDVKLPAGVDAVAFAQDKENTDHDSPVVRVSPPRVAEEDDPAVADAETTAGTEETADTTTEEEK